MIDVVILNRNLGNIADNLFHDVVRFGIPNENIVVVDSGSDNDKLSKFTTLRFNDLNTKESGLRPSRGFNHGITELLSRKSSSEWILLLPVDARILKFDFVKLMQSIQDLERIQAIKPISPTSGYLEFLEDRPESLVWSIEEGPIMIRKSFIQLLSRTSGEDIFFDADNFRGLYTSLELAFRVYGNAGCILLTSMIEISEDKSFQIEKSALIKTEPIDIHMQLMLREGNKWLHDKYGILDAKSLSEIVRLSFDNFLQCYPEYAKLTSRKL